MARPHIPYLACYENTGPMWVVALKLSFLIHIKYSTRSRYRSIHYYYTGLKIHAVL